MASQVPEEILVEIFLYVLCPYSNLGRVKR